MRRAFACLLLLLTAGCNSGALDEPGLVIRSGVFLSDAAPRRLESGEAAWQIECFIGRAKCLDRARLLCGGGFEEIRPANADAVPPVFDDFDVPNRVTVFARCLPDPTQEEDR